MPVPRAARVAALLAVMATLAAACGSDEPTAAPTTTTTASASSSTTVGATASTTATSDPVRTIEVTYAGGQVVGGVRTETVRLGEKVRLRVTSDVAEEVHVHTYDVTADVAAGQTVDVDVDAIIPGRHEVELEKKGKPLLVLEVK